MASAAIVNARTADLVTDPTPLIAEVSSIGHTCATTRFRGRGRRCRNYSNVPPNGPHAFKLPVIGGTGVYDNARGYVVVRDVGDGTLGRSKIDFHLTP